MKTACGILTLVALLASAGAEANCRAADAARLGSDAGLARDQAAARTAADQERANSDILGRCISGITAIQVVPAFPSPMDIFNAVATRMCTLANNAIPINQIPVPAGWPTGAPIGTVPAARTPARTAGQLAAPASATSASDFWGRMWR